MDNLEDYFINYASLCADYALNSTNKSTNATTTDYEANSYSDYCVDGEFRYDSEDPGMRAERIYVPILFGLTYLIGNVGNGLVVFVIANQCSFKCVTNIYLLNLAIADLIFLALCIPFTGIVFIASWPFGEIMCKMLNYFTAVPMAVSVMTLTAMSVDRYYAVLKPVDSKRYRTPTLTLTLIVIIWAISLVSLIPIFLVSIVRGYPSQDKMVYMCMEYIPSQTPRQVYTLLVFFMYYALPMGLITMFYALMAQSLWTSVSPSFLRDNMMKALNYRKKVAKMLLVIVTVFMICVTPLHIIKLFDEFGPTPRHTGMIHIKIVAHCFAYMNSATNPIIYAFMSRNFRKCFKDAFMSCKSLHSIQLRPFRDPEELPKSVTMGMRLLNVDNSVQQKSTSVCDTKA